MSGRADTLALQAEADRRGGPPARTAMRDRDDLSTAGDRAYGGAVTAAPPPGPTGDGLDGAPPEDRGHDTAVWYEFQYACTALELLGLLRDPSAWVLCEWHTDYVVGSPDGVRPVLVSVKHRSMDRGPWRVADLLADGGLRTLLARWDAAGRTGACRFVTNTGLATGAGEARELARLLATNPAADHPDVAAFAAACAGRLGADAVTAAEFLTGLRFVSQGADGYAMAARGVEYARDVLGAAGHDRAHARAAFDAAVAAVRQAVLACDRVNPPTQWLFGQDAAEAARAARTLAWPDLQAAFAAAGVPVLEPNVPAARLGGDTVLGRKLRAGGLGPSVLAAAPRLRQQWYEIECKFRPDLPAGPADMVGTTRGLVSAHAGAAETAVRRPGDQYGQPMYLELERRLAAAEAPLRTVGPHELLGCAYMLTAACEIWWSEPFDTTAEAPWTVRDGPAS